MATDDMQVKLDSLAAALRRTTQELLAYRLEVRPDAPYDIKCHSLGVEEGMHMAASRLLTDLFTHGLVDFADGPIRSNLDPAG